MKTHFKLITALCATALLSACGGDDSVTPTPPATAASATLNFETKTFRFNWSDVSDATHYKLMENPDGISGLSQVGSDIKQGTQTIDHTVALYNRVNASYILQSCNTTGCTDGDTINISSTLVDAIGYFKASNTGAVDYFGDSVSLSADGNTLAVGAYGEDSASTGINSTPDELAPDAGAVYVYSRNGASWTEQAYIKASNTGENDRFGISVSLSDDGNTLAVGAYGEATFAGAVHVYSRNVTNWAEQAYIKASNTGAADRFGYSVSLSTDGNTLAVGAYGEDSASTGINSTPDELASSAGAVYVFSYDGTNWIEQAYIKASNTGGGDWFGYSVNLSGDSNTLAVGAYYEASATIGINSTPDELAYLAGAVYVFSYDGTNWAERAYIKASNAGENDRFGISVSLSDDGNTLAVGAYGEDSASTGINSTPDVLGSFSGAVYVFSYDGTNWAEQAYIKASNTGEGDGFGYSVSLSADGNTLAVGADGEDSASTGINSTPDELATDASAVYVYSRSGASWTEQAYIKASNTEEGDYFGGSVSLSGDGNTLAVGADFEDSASTGINSTPDESAYRAGAVYLY